MKLKFLLSVATATFIAGMNPSFAGDPNTMTLEQIKQMTISEMISTYRSQLGEVNFANEQQTNAQSRVVTQYDVFKYRLSRMIGGSQFSAIEIVGFSGAGYNDVERFKEQVRGQITAEAERVKDGKVVLVLGGSIDGIGAAYEVADKLRTEGMKNLIVVGMVAQDVVKYQLEGQVQGWGDVLSPKQDLLLLVDNSKNGQQGSWELTEKPNGASRTVDIVLDLAKLPNNLVSRFQAYEGGEQSLKEGIELAARTSTVPSEKPITIDLFVGHEPAEKQVRKGKDKGFRAATQLAGILMTPERISTSNTYINMNIATNIAAYAQKIAAIEALLKNPEATIADLEEKVKVEEAKDAKSAETNVAKAELAKARAVINTDAFVSETLNKSLAIMSEGIELAREARNDAINEFRGYKTPGYKEAALSAEHSYTQVLRQVETLKSRIQQLDSRIRERAVTSKIK